MNGRIFAAVDIGTTKICVLTAEMTEKGPRVLGTGTALSRGIRKGVVVNIDEAAHSVRAAVHEASAADSGVMPAVIGITGRHIAGFSSTGVIGLQGREITVTDRQRAIESAKTVYVPLDREVLQVIPQEFVLDGQTGITDPVGMSGVRLESKVYIVTAHSPSVQNLLRACDQAGLEVCDTVLQVHATAGAVLTKEELDNGAVLIDIGGGTTDISLFRDGAMVHASGFGIGGLHITNDLAIGLRISAAEAEKIKKSAGNIFSSADGDMVEICGEKQDMQKVSMQLIHAVIQPRCEELFEKVSEELKLFRPEDLAGCSVVITGGTALLGGIKEFASSVFRMPVRIGLPQGPVGLKSSLRTPSYAAGIGLVNHAARKEKNFASCSNESVFGLTGFAEKIKSLIGQTDLVHIF